MELADILGLRDICVILLNGVVFQDILVFLVARVGIEVHVG